MWVADVSGSGAVRGFARSGEEVGRVEVPARMVTSVCFGGADRRDMYIVTGDNTERAATGAARSTAPVPMWPAWRSRWLASEPGQRAGTGRHDELRRRAVRRHRPLAGGRGASARPARASSSSPRSAPARASRACSVRSPSGSRRGWPSTPAGAPGAVVDLGAGLGGATAWLAAATGATVIGVEPESGSRDAAHRLFGGLDVRAGSAADTGLDAGRADVVVADRGHVSLLDDARRSVRRGPAAAAPGRLPRRSSTCSSPTVTSRSTARTRCARSPRRPRRPCSRLLAERHRPRRPGEPDVRHRSSVRDSVGGPSRRGVGGRRRRRDRRPAVGGRPRPAHRAVVAAHPGRPPSSVAGRPSPAVGWMATGTSSPGLSRCRRSRTPGRGASPTGCCGSTCRTTTPRRRPACGGCAAWPTPRPMAPTVRALDRLATEIAEDARDAGPGDARPRRAAQAGQGGRSPRSPSRPGC